MFKSAQNFFLPFVLLLFRELIFIVVFKLRNPTPSLFNDKYTFCDKCFNDIAGDTVALTDDPSAPQT
jgi:hypothetical protein